MSQSKKKSKPVKAKRKARVKPEREWALIRTHWDGGRPCRPPYFVGSFHGDRRDALAEKLSAFPYALIIPVIVADARHYKVVPL